MKLQTGVRVDAEVWRAYRVVCGREKLRPSQPIEDFLRLVIDSDSGLHVLRMMGEVAKSRTEGFDAYARVLLDWYDHGKFWFRVLDEEASVEGLLLEALKVVADSDLRRRIEEALVARQREIFLKNKEVGKVEENGGTEPKGDG